METRLYKEMHRLRKLSKDQGSEAREEHWRAQELGSHLIGDPMSVPWK